MNLINVKNIWMCAIVQFCEVGLLTVNFVIAVAGTEIRNYIWPLTKLQRRYRCMCSQAKCTAESGEEPGGAWLREKSVSKEGVF